MCSMHRSKARLQAKIESMFCIQSPSCLNTSHQHCCNSRWKDLVVKNAVEILPGCREISVRRNQCLRKFMCLQKQGKVLFPQKSIKLFCSGRAGFVRGCPRARKSLCGSPQHSKKTLLYKGSTCADCICSEKACLLQPLLASGICYYSEAAIYQHTWTCKLAGACLLATCPYYVVPIPKVYVYVLFLLLINNYTIYETCYFFEFLVISNYTIYEICPNPGFSQPYSRGALCARSRNAKYQLRGGPVGGLGFRV